MVALLENLNRCVLQHYLVRWVEEVMSQICDIDNAIADKYAPVSRCLELSTSLP